MQRYDLTTAMGRFKAHWSYFWKDHAFLRTAFTNAHWLGPDLVLEAEGCDELLDAARKRGCPDG